MIDPVLRRGINRCVTESAPWPLAILGGVGTGKTCAALCLLDAVGGGCVYTTVTEFAANIMAAQSGQLWDQFTDEKMTPVKLWHQWREATLAVLDELGSRSKVSDFQYEIVKRAIDEREKVAGPLVLISNMGLPELESVYDDRIASRIAAGTVINLQGDDRRISSGF